MDDGWDVAEGDPWSVSFGPNEFTRVVRLRVGDFTIALSALSAHKLGSALHAASGIDTTEGVAAERERIWTAIRSWTEIAHRLDDDDQLVVVEGTEFRPLAPFSDELHAMVFNLELSTDEPESSHHAPDPEVRRDEPVSISLRGSARPVQPAGRPPDTVRPEGVEREALEGQHAQDDTGPTS